MNMDPGVILDKDRQLRPPSAAASYLLVWRAVATALILSATISIMFWGYQTSTGLDEQRRFLAKLEAHLDRQDHDVARLRSELDQFHTTAAGIQANQESMIRNQSNMINLLKRP